MKKSTRLIALAALAILGVAWRRRRRPASQPVSSEPCAQPHPAEQEESTLTPDQARRVDEYYRAIQAERDKRCPPGFRYLKRDRYGCLYEKNPNGFGWREWGSDPDEPYEVRRLD